MIFNCDIEDTADQLLPPPFYQPIQRQWMWALLRPVKELLQIFLSYRIDTLKKMRYNGQTIVLENLLNDLFDVPQRRIQVLTTYDTLNATYIGLKGEGYFAYIGLKSENYPHLPLIPNITNPPYIGLEQEYTEDADIKIIVPTGTLSITQQVQLKAIVQRYKLAGKLALFYYSDGTQF